MDFIRNITQRLSKQFSKSGDWQWEDHVLGTMYGNAVGDTIGLLTEFMEKKEAKEYYGQYKGKLEYNHKESDIHRDRWAVGDWTDDTDQMVLIMISLMEKEGKIDPVDFGVRLLEWKKHGYPELGDTVGMGIGTTTGKVLSHPQYKVDPHQAAKDVWEANFKRVAPNGGVMRTSVLGIYQYDDMDKVMHNAKEMCTVTHYHPRCQASCVAVTTAIAMMLQRRPEHVKDNGDYNIKAIMNDSFQFAQRCFPEVDGQPDKEEIELLRTHMFAPDLSVLDLAEAGKIGYTYKCMGSGFWALRQNDFRKAITAVLFEAGDADTNCAVAGALLGCKLGFRNIPDTWISGLKHKDWFQGKIDSFLKLVNDDIVSRGGTAQQSESRESEKGEQDKGSEAAGGCATDTATDKSTNPTEPMNTETTTTEDTTQNAEA